jgi:hypothetical protein
MPAPPSGYPRAQPCHFGTCFAACQIIFSRTFGAESWGFKIKIAN